MAKLLEGIWTEILYFYDVFLDKAPLIVIGLVVSLLFLWMSKRIRLKTTKMIKAKADDPLQINFFSDIFKTINAILAVLIFLYVIGKQSIVTSILGAGAVSAFVIGFAFKDIGENFLAGFILAFKRPFRIGDVVKVTDIEGSIIDLNLRETHIKTFDGKDVYIPNGMLLKNPLHNYTIDGFLRQSFTIGIDYNANVMHAREIILSTVNSIPGVLHIDKIAKTLISSLEPSTLNITVQYWINTFDKSYSGSEIKSQAITDTLDNLHDAGIQTPGTIVEVLGLK